MTVPKVSIIFVNYKTPKMTSDAINSVKEKTKNTTYEIIVVDNSCDKDEFNQLVCTINDNNIKIIDANNNLGFGKANNLGSQHALGEYLFFLNTDTLLINDAISILSKYLDEHTNVGVVGPNLYTKDLKPNHSFLSKEKNISNDSKNEKLLTYLFRVLFKNKKDFNYSLKAKIVFDVCGAALMIRKDVFSKLNGFDKDIFMYAEETLLNYRVKNELNYDIVNVPTAKIIHFDGGSFNKLSNQRARFIVDGNFIYYTKAFGLNTAIKYLNVLKRLYKRKIILFKIIDKKEKIKQYTILLDEIVNKLNMEMQNENTSNWCKRSIRL